MERHQIIEAMTSLKLYGMRASFDEIAGKGLGRRDELEANAIYDLVATQAGNPLQPLSDFLPQAKDVGLHMIVARRTGGASRSTYDPVIGKLKEISSPGYIGSGSKDEGVLWGTVKPSVQPPGRGTIITRKLGQQRMQIAWLQAD